MRYEVIAFDVNETLLDVSVLGAALEEAVGETVAVGEWFARLLHRSLLANQLGRHRPFGELGVEALMWLAARESAPLDREQAMHLVAGMTRLPAHPDVQPGLRALAGRRLVSLTNGSHQVVTRQLGYAGLASYFELTLSVDAVERFKPDPAVYRYAAEACGVDIDRLLLVAAHDWDVAGAQAAGAGGCFVRRQPWGLGDVEPDLTVDGITGLAAVLED